MKLKRIVRSDHCLNCNTPLPGEINYCPQCGQLNNIRKETATGLLKELVEDFLHLDNKVTGSLIPLLFRPGKLTTEYTSGRRARYLHPVRLFISVTIIMLIITSVAKNENITFNTKAGTETSDTLRTGFTIGFNDSLVRYSDLKAKLDSGITDPETLLGEFGIENTSYNRFVMKKAIRLGSMSWGEIAAYVKSKIPWILFALMPVFAMIIYLVYINKKIWFVDHLIYSFHLHSATFIIISINQLLSWMMPFLGTSLLLYIPFYYFISLKKVYGQRWGNTLLKGTLAGILYCISGIVFAGLVIGILFIAI